VVALAGCGGGALSPREGCLTFEAGPSLHLYDGEAHALNVLIFPLIGPSAFEQASLDSLIAQQSVDGATGPALSVMLSPGEVREIREIFPGTTEYLGVVANYYQGGNDNSGNPGNRRAVVVGKCSMFGSDTIKLTARDLLVD